MLANNNQYFLDQEDKSWIKYRTIPYNEPTNFKRSYRPEKTIEVIRTFSVSTSLFENIVNNLSKNEIKITIKHLSKIMRQDIIRSILKLRFELFTLNPIFAKGVYNEMLMISSSTGCLLIADMALEKGANEYEKASNMARIHGHDEIINLIEKVEQGKIYHK